MSRSSDIQRQEELDHDHTNADAQRRTLDRLVTELQAISLLSQGRVRELLEPGPHYGGVVANEHQDEATLFDLQQRMAQVAHLLTALNPSSNAPPRAS